MTMKKTFSILLVLCMLLGYMGVVAIASPETIKADVSVDNALIPGTFTPNTQVYGEENKKHTIYWAQGVDAPKMPDNPADFGKGRYFSKELYNNSIVYHKEVEEGKGYYDLNKNRISNHCYLGASANMIYWWLDQNKVYIDEFYQHLMNDDSFGQPKGLRDIKNEQLWATLNQRPVLSDVTGGWDYQLLTDKLVTNILSPYVIRTDGYWMDKVFDFFFNGYIAESDDFMNEEANYKMDPLGGIFYPIFGNKRLTDRVTGITYRQLSDYLGALLSKGYGVTLSHKAVGPDLAHALTIWGAEYDENGDLYMIYITDTDDFGYFGKDNKAYGIRSLFVNEGTGGLPYITSETNLSPDKPGTMLTSIGVLSLGQEKFKERLSDLTAPSMPTIDKEPVGNNYTTTSVVDPLTIKATSTDKGYLTYQWYVADSEGEVGKKILNATKTSYTPPNNVLGKKYYYCNVINNKNGKETIKQSNYVLINVDNNLVDAETPKVTFPSGTKNYYKYSSPKPIFANASVSDGGELSYEWYARANWGQSASGGGTLMAGENKNYIIPSTKEVGYTYYYCKVTNYKKDATGNKRVSVTVPYAYRIVVDDAEYVNASLPVIAEHPISSEYNSGQSIKALSVFATSPDDGTLSYQWYRANDEYEIGTAIDGANDRVYQPTAVGSYYYYCRVTNTNMTAPYEKSSSRDSNRALIKIDGTVHQHTFGKWQVRTPATCVDKGLEYRTCSVCGVEETREINALGHKYVDKHNATHHYKECSVCGDIIDEQPHILGKWQVRTPATCVDNGLEYRTCSVCGVEETREINALGHKYVDKHNATHHYKECNVCGDIIDEREHVFEKWDIVKEPTPTETGIRRATCECGFVKEEVIPKLDPPPTPPVEPGEGDVPSNPDIDVPPAPDVDNPETKPDVETPEVPETKPELDNNNSNTALIVGLSVGLPVGIGVIIAVVVLIIKKKH